MGKSSHDIQGRGLAFLPFLCYFLSPQMFFFLIQVCTSGMENSKKEQIRTAVPQEKAEAATFILL